MSKNEIRTTYLPQKYIFTTSSYQMAILTQFNVNDSLTFKDIQEGTRIAEGYLKPQMALLVKAKVLLQDGDTYELNMSKCPTGDNLCTAHPPRLQVEEDQGQLEPACASGAEGGADGRARCGGRGPQVCLPGHHRSLDEGKKGAQACRIPDSNTDVSQRMVHQALIQEVVSTISTKFTPKVPEIKKAIDHLLDQEYLERSEEGKDV